MGGRIKLEGTTINDLYVKEYIGNNYYTCVCKRCGEIRECRAYELSRGKFKACKDCEVIERLDVDIADIDAGYWKILKTNKENHKKFDCICTLCNRQFVVPKAGIRKKASRCCVECSQKLRIKEDLTQKQFTSGKVIGYLGASLWSCTCGICGKELKRITTKLANQDKILCNNCSGTELRHKIVPGQTFGNWETIKYIPDTVNYHNKWLCKCKLCGAEKEVFTYNLVSGHSESCGCAQLVDLKGQTFFEWTVLEYSGNGYWKCRCSCGTIRDVQGFGLRSGDSKSCGCKKMDHIRQTMIFKHGELQVNKKNKRTQEQLEYVKDKDSLLKAIKDNFGDKKPSTYELSQLLGLNDHCTLKYIHRYNLENYVDIGGYTSRQEKEITDLVKELVGEAKVVSKDRSILGKQELDIYIPDKNLAIEVNGVYWHSDLYKDKLYHQNKTINCIRKGIRLIHIFEDEWADTEKRTKIISIIKSALGLYSTKLGARECEVKLIEFKTAKEFLDKYHIQGGGAVSKINIGCYKGDKLVGVMTFGPSRYDNTYEWEIIRECWLPDTAVIGGSERMFKYFQKLKNPQSVLSYCDASKFLGKVYLRLGFKLSTYKPITDPNYVWVQSFSDGEYMTLSRYKTQKSKLLEQGLGRDEQTEDEIMTELGFVKVYNSGNLRFAWRKEG